MKIAILGNTANGYVKPMAEGLHRMMLKAGGDTHLLYQGIERFSQVPMPFLRYVQDKSKGNLAKNTLRYVLKEVPNFYPFILQLRRFDAVIVVNSIARAFLTDFFCDESVRSFLPDIPIILYDVFYLPTRGPWGKWLKEGNPERGVPTSGNWGLERYDWYLVASVVSECPMPPGSQPYSLIGLNLEDGTLSPQKKKDFRALIDFAQPGHEEERAIQIEACKKTRTTFTVLEGTYSLSDIRRIYRESSIYFVAHRESFGIPICELQACGSYVFTPYSNWCPSHWIKPNIFKEGPGQLPPNFVVYNNDLQTLVGKIETIRQSYNPRTVFDSFIEYHPELYFGNQAELERFLAMLEKHYIRSGSCKQYGHIIAPTMTGPFGDVPPIATETSDSLLRSTG
jgi:hypothetical protein